MRKPILAALVSVVGAGCGNLLGVDDFHSQSAQGGTIAAAGTGGGRLTDTDTPTGGSSTGGAGGSGGGSAGEGNRGQVQWSQSFGNVLTDRGLAIAAVPASDCAVVAGLFDEEVSFGGAPLVDLGHGDIFVASFEPDGSHVWSHGFGGDGLDLVHGIAVGDTGNIVLVGEYLGQLDFHAQPLTTTHAPSAFVAIIEADGDHVFSQGYGTDGEQRAFDVAVAPTGDVVVVGSVQGEVDFGDGPIAGGSDDDAFVLKLSPEGVHRWSKRLGDSARQVARGVAVDAAGNIAVTGGFAGTMDLGCGPIQARAEDVFVAKLTADGSCVWSKPYGEAGTSDAADQFGADVAAAATGELVVTGAFEQALDLGPAELHSAGAYDAFVAKFAADGSHVWSRALGAGPTTDEQGCHVAIDAGGEVVLAGSFDGDTDFGGGVVVGAGGTDAFLARYGPAGQHL